MFVVIGWRFAVVDSRILCRWRLRGEAWVKKSGQYETRKPRWPALRLGGRLAVQWITPVALSAVFVGLFTLANPIIENWVDSTGERLMRLGMRLPDFLGPRLGAPWGASPATTSGLDGRLGDRRATLRIHNTIRSVACSKRGRLHFGTFT